MFLTRWRGRAWCARSAAGRCLAYLLSVAALAAACASAPGPGAAGGTTALVGAPAPEFSLRDAAGRPVSLEYFRGQRHVVLVFYIGHT